MLMQCGYDRISVSYIISVVEELVIRVPARALILLLLFAFM